MINSTNLDEYKQSYFEPKDAEDKRLLEYALSNEKLKEQISKEIDANLKAVANETDIYNPKNPFFYELCTIQNAQKNEDLDYLNLKKELENTPTGAENSCDLEFYAKQASKKKRELSKEVLDRNCKKDLLDSLELRYQDYVLSELNKAREKYLKEMYKNIEKYKKLQDLLGDMADEYGDLWDLSKGELKNYGFELLEHFAKILQNDKGLRELAEMIGRAKSESDKYQTELREKTELKSEYIVRPAYRGQIKGLRLSSEIATAIPSELALYQNPTTKLYFMQKFAEQKMLSYAYANRTRQEYSEICTEEVQVSVEEKKGPVIICVDTSGSMSGTPESVAKTITFALAKKCLKERRACFLISFSTGIEVRDLGAMGGANGLQNLIDFLGMSFNGGTDATPALQKSLETLRTNEYKNADVLMVSDFVMNNLGGKVMARIKAEQANGTKFYSLVIGSGSNNSVVAGFDENWYYDENAPQDSMRKLVRNICTTF